MGKSNPTVQRTGASRLAQRQIEHQWRLAPVADLSVPYDMPDRKQFLGRWISWIKDARVEEEHFDDGRFEGVVFNEDSSIFGSSKGTWDLKSDSIQWRYTSSENIPVPKGVETDTITQWTDTAISLRSRNGPRTDLYRLVESGETSANFDWEEVQPFLKRVAALVDSGLGLPEIDGLIKKVKKLKPDQSCYFTFPVVFGGTAAPLRIRVFMDDLDAPDIYVHAPRKLANHIDEEIKKLDTQS